MKTSTEDWYKTWFDTFYYHQLYQNRNYDEASLFIENLVNYLSLNKDDHVLDLACGKGRHSIYLNQLGFNVLGLDLSVNSIREANKSSNNRLRFDVHDMRNVYQENQFDVVLNLFTSFGYFKEESENILVLKSINKMLHEKGRLVLDFINCRKAISNLVYSEIKEMDEVRFEISRKFQDKKIIKEINVFHGNEQLKFVEMVQALELKDFQKFFKIAGFNILETFGDYQLNNFDEKNSDRLILIAESKL